MNASTPNWSLLYYRTREGRTPVVEFLNSLDPDHKAQAVAMIEMLREYGATLRTHSKMVETGLFELKGHQVRIFYIFLPGRRIVLLDGIMKKQDLIPKHEKKRIQRIRKDAEDQYGGGAR